MNRELKYIMTVCLCLLGVSACDEGKIYPDNTIDNGRTATITLHFTGLDAWPQKNSMSLVSLGEDSKTPILVKRILEPSSEAEVVTMTLNNLTEETRGIAIAVVTSGMSLVHSYRVFSAGTSDDALILPETTINVATFGRIQSQVFNQKCVVCHGGSTSLAGDLDLTSEKSYDALFNVKAPHSNDGKSYVTPEDLDNCYLLDVMNHDNHVDIFNGAERREVLALIRTWIKAGAEDN
nr:hypothetical protein [uncultured Bacteroides sp.]